MEVAVVTLSNRPALSDITWPVMEKYCAKHNYAFHTVDDTLDVTRHPAWSKLMAINMTLEQDSAEMVVWMDDDLYITNPSMPLDALVEETPFDRILMTKDSGPWSSFNSGIMFCKNTDEVKAHLDFIYDLSNTNYHDVERFHQEPMWEQSAMDFFHKTIDNNFYRIVPMHPIQGFVNEHLTYNRETGARVDWFPHSMWLPGLFAAHIPGREMSVRIRALNDLAAINKWEE